MKKILRIICWIKTGWRSFERWLETGFDGIIIDGCEFEEQKDGKLKCKICGKID